jgi:hypothetical protein
MVEKCEEHSGVCTQLETVASQTSEQWTELKEVRKSINGIKNWIMGLMGILVVQLILQIVSMAK